MGVPKHVFLGAGGFKNPTTPIFLRQFFSVLSTHAQGSFIQKIADFHHSCELPLRFDGTQAFDKFPVRDGRQADDWRRIW